MGFHLPLNGFDLLVEGGQGPPPRPGRYRIRHAHHGRAAAVAGHAARPGSPRPWRECRGGGRPPASTAIIPLHDPLDAESAVTRFGAVVHDAWTRYVRT